MTADLRSATQIVNACSLEPTGGQEVFAANALAGRKALITGGASGIGLGIARAFARAGAQVVLASRNAERLETAVAMIQADGGEATSVVADVRHEAAVEMAVDTAVSKFGGLDILIANAAGNFIRPVSEMSFNAWRTVIDIDLHGTFLSAKAAYQALKGSPHGGCFVAISTMRALEGWPGCAHAAAAKAGVMSLVRSLAVEWGPDGIRCNTIAPGPIDGTEGVNRLYADATARARQLAGVPLGRLGQIGDVANAALFLCSDAGRFVTGADLVVDGGRQRT